jgi:hypothetical protein
MHTDEMRQAMSTLKAFSEKERAYHAYQARQNYLRQQRSIQPDTALRLARFFNTSEGFWLGPQADFDLEAARLKLGLL